jgi:catechol 2,3-dioxygenase-like lactoylglutathione lyase family enzyme
MTHKGFSHIGLSTLDINKTRAFYEGVLGFRLVGDDTITIEEGGHLRHMFSMSAAASSSPFWNRMAFPMYPTNTMRGSIAASGFLRPFITSRSRRGHPPRSPRSVTSCATRV